jgi:hypothetical protein
LKISDVSLKKVLLSLLPLQIADKTKPNQMSFSFLILGALLLIFGNMEAATGDGRYIRVSSRNPHYFEYSDGQTFIPVGPNICWERFEKDEVKVLKLYEQRFKNLSENGGNYARIWLSASFFEIEHEQAGQYDEKIVSRIDQILEMANRYDIKVKFCLEHFRKLNGYPAKFLGSVSFDKPIYSQSSGGSLCSMDEYFNSEAGHDLFMNRVLFLASRYNNHTSVFGWELWNEMNSVPISDSPASLLNWTRNMLPEVKAAFPNQLVMQSLGSFDHHRKIELYRSYMSLSDNEVAQVHRYLDTGATWDICQAPMDILASQAVGELRRMVRDKPVVLSEVGAVEANHAGPSKLYPIDTTGILLHDMLFAPFFSGAAAPGQSWHWQLYIEKNNLWWHFKRFVHAIEDIDPVEENYQPFFEEHDSIRFYGLKGKTNTLVWCRNARNNWETELVEHQKPQAVSIQIPLQLLKCSSPVSIRIYDPWNDTWTNAFHRSEITIPSIERSVVLKIAHR